MGFYQEFEKNIKTMLAGVRGVRKFTAIRKLVGIDGRDRASVQYLIKTLHAMPGVEKVGSCYYFNPDRTWFVQKTPVKPEPGRDTRPLPAKRAPLSVHVHEWKNVLTALDADPVGRICLACGAYESLK